MLELSLGYMRMRCVRLSLRILFLCKADNIGWRALLPLYLIWLEMDQEAHDFIKWYNDNHHWELCVASIGLFGIMLAPF